MKKSLCFLINNIVILYFCVKTKMVDKKEFIHLKSKKCYFFIVRFNLILGNSLIKKEVYGKII
ncbi:hypothetical protein D920_00569 [Enterococcus faecalis 13-SD-W-01]|nr:hypothetical protein D920_00569 [Enterococcus faecalis 13-SD-W-01]